MQMGNRLTVIWEMLRTSLWPIPAIMALLAVALWWSGSHIDGELKAEQVEEAALLWKGTGDDARNLLSTIVSSILGLAGVLFSITMVVLSLAANQFSSRVVRTYTTDRRTQVTLGIFLMTVVFGLLALREVEKDMPAGQVPDLLVAMGLGLTFLCLAATVMFLSNVARLMVADEVIDRVGRELEAGIATLPPTPCPHPVEDPEEIEPAVRMEAGEGCAIIRSTEEGYVQAIEYEKLVKVAAQAGVTIRLDYRAGAYMCCEGWLARVQPEDRSTPRLATEIQQHIVIGEQRTATQDLEYSIRHLVDIALRALSPGINDPNTALVVLDRLRGALSRLMGRQMPRSIYRDEAGTVRVVADRTDFAGLLKAAFHQIRQAGAAKPAVATHILGTIARLAEHARNDAQAEALLHHAEVTAAAALRAIEEPGDRADVQKALEAARHMLMGAGPRRQRAGMVEADRAAAAEDKDEDEDGAARQRRTT